MAPYETPHWTGPPPRPERDVRTEIAGWFARYAFFLLLLFFIGLVVAALAFVPSLRGGNDISFELGSSPSGSAESPIAAVPYEGVAPEGITLLNVSTNPAGAMVQIDIDSIGTTPLYRRPVDRKVHLLSVVKPGYARIDTVLFADDFRNDTTSFFFVLHPAPTDARRNLAVDETGTIMPSQVDASRPTAASTGPDVPREVPRQQRPVERQPTAQPSQQSPEPVNRPRARGSLAVTSDPIGASVSLDGRVVGITPLNIPDVDSGNRIVELKMDGYETERSVVTVRGGVRSRVESTLSSASGTLVVLARPYGSIYIDGKLLKRDLDIEYRTTLPAGPHVVSVSHPVLGQLTHTVEIGRTERSVVFDFNKMNVVSN